MGISKLLTALRSLPSLLFPKKEEAPLTPSPVKPEPETSTPEVPPVQTLLHVVFYELEKYSGDSAILRHARDMVDQLLATRGEQFLADLEKAMLVALSIRYPVIALFLAQYPQEKTTPAPGQDTPSGDKP